MRAAMRFLGSVVLVALCGARAAAAQYPQTREGFWWGFGLGYGSVTETCSGRSSVSRGVVTGWLKAGGTMSPHVLLGGAGNFFDKESGGRIETLGNLTASVFYYPASASGFLLTGGLGFSIYDVRGGSGPTTTGFGWGFTAGAGYDIRVARNLSLTPVVDFVYGGVGDLTSGQAIVATGWKQTVIDLALGVTWH